MLEGYSYLGLDKVIARTHPQTGVNLTYVGQAVGSDGGDEYTGLARSGRVINLNARKGQSKLWLSYPLAHEIE